MADLTATYKALADFSQLERAARKARNELIKLKAATTTANADFVDQSGDVERAQTRTTRTTRDQTKAFSSFSETMREATDSLDDHTDSLVGKYFPAVSKTRAEVNAASKDHDRYTRSVQRAGGGSDRTGRKVRSLGERFRDLGQNIGAAGRVMSLLKFPAVAAGVGLLASAVGALSVGVIGLVSNLGPLLGLLGALPGLAFAGAAAIGTLFLGFRGLGDALKGLEKSEQRAGKAAETAGRQREAAAKRVRGAERALIKAQEAATRAQEDLNDAREEAVEKLEDLRRAVRQDAIDEEQALVDLERARRRQLELAVDPNATFLDFRDAALAVRQAEIDLERTRSDRAENLEELQDREAKGIEGSDEVVSALERLEDAEESVALAQENLAEALQDQTDALGGASSAVSDLREEYDKLGPNAQRFVQWMREAKEQISAFSRAIQEELLPGVQRAGEALVELLTVKLRDGFTGLAGVLGDVIGDLGEQLGSDEWAADLNWALGETADHAETLGQVLSNVLDALRNIMVAAAPIVDWLGEVSLKWSEMFLAWSEAERAGGGEFFKKAIDTAQQWGRILGDIGAGLRDIMGLGSEVGQSIVDSIEATTQKFREWAAGDGQSAITAWFEEGEKGLRALTGLLGDIIKLFFSLENQEAFTKIINQLREDFVPALARLIEVFQGEFSERLVDLLVSVTELVAALGDAGGGGLTTFLEVLDGIVSAMNTLIEKFPALGTAVGAGLAAVGAKKALNVGTLGMSDKVGRKVKEKVQDRLAKRAARKAGEAAAGAAPAAAGGAATGMKKLKDAAGKALPKVKSLATKFIPMLTGAVTALATALGISVGWLLAIVAAVVIVGVIIVKNWDTIKEAIGTAVDWIGEKVAAAWEWIKEKTAQAWEAIKTFFSGLWEDIKEIFRKVVDWLGERLSGAWDAIKDTATRAWNGIKDFFSELWEGIKNVVGRAADWLGERLSGAWNAIKDTATRVWDTITGAIDTALGAVKDAFSSAASFVGRVWDTMMGAVAGPVEWFVNTVVGTGIVGSLNKVLDFLGLDMRIPVPKVSLRKPATSSAVGPSRIGGYNKGGRVPGTGNKDTVPAYLTPGEFVIRKDAVKKIGIDQLRFLNAARFQTGGFVEGIAGTEEFTSTGASDPASRENDSPSALERAGGFLRDLGSGAADLVRSGAGALLSGLLKPVRWAMGQGLGKLGRFGDLLGGGANFVMDKAIEWVKKKEEEGGIAGKLRDQEFEHSGRWPRRQYMRVAQNTLQAAKFIKKRWGLRDIGMLGQRSNKSDHPWGKALDAMTYDDTRTGTKIATWFARNPHEFGTKYIIWHDQINSGRRGWRPYVHPSGNRKNPTLRHLDHVHVSFLNSGGLVGGGKGFARPARLNTGGLVGGSNFLRGMGRGLAKRPFMPDVSNFGAAVMASSQQMNDNGFHVGQIVINNPVPERSSESLPRTLRKLEYLGRGR